MSVNDKIRKEVALLVDDGIHVISFPFGNSRDQEVTEAIAEDHKHYLESNPCKWLGDEEVGEGGDPAVLSGGQKGKYCIPQLNDRICRTVCNCCEDERPPSEGRLLDTFEHDFDYPMYGNPRSSEMLDFI